jgi:hypothetical protein
MLQPAVTKLDLREEQYWIESPHAALQLFLRHLPPVRPLAGRPQPVIYVHGATFPPALSTAHCFDGFSWRAQPYIRDGPFLMAVFAFANVASVQKLRKRDADQACEFRRHSPAATDPRARH